MMPLRDRKALATLVRIRKRQEDLHALAFAGARRILDTLREERASIAKEQRRMLEEAGEIIQDTFDPSEARRYYQYERYLAKLGDQKDADIRARESQAESLRLELETAMKKRRMVELLEDKNQLAWHQEFRKREQVQLDEVALSYGRLKSSPYHRMNHEEAEKR